MRELPENHPFLFIFFFPGLCMLRHYVFDHTVFIYLFFYFNYCGEKDQHLLTILFNTLSNVAFKAPAEDDF